MVVASQMPIAKGTKCYTRVFGDIPESVINYKPKQNQFDCGVAGPSYDFCSNLTGSML